MSAIALNCPNCGAALASDSSNCEFCRSRLKTVACPSCLGLMFLGTKYCGHCGEEVIAAETQKLSEGKCPRCRIKLREVHIASVLLSECAKCSGMWVSVDVFEDICSSREDQAAVLKYGSSGGNTVEELPKISYVPCPACGQLMNRSNFARASGVIIDTCKHHGVWFDANELSKIVEFIRTGGLKRAREREVRDIEENRKRLRDEQRTSRLQGRRFEKESPFELYEGGLKGFLRKLFD